MALKPVKGKIESQELNDNFSYLSALSSDPLGAMQASGKKVSMDLLGNDVVSAMTGETEITSAKGYFENNRGVVFPLHNKVRDGDLPNVSENVKNVVLGATVINPNKDKLYAIAYVSKGFSDSYGISIVEYGKDSFSVNSESERKLLLDYRDMPFSQESGIVTRTIEIDNTIFIITVDYDAIPGVGLNISNTLMGAGMGCVIHESNYVYSIGGDFNKSGFENNRGFEYPLRNVMFRNEVGIISDAAKSAILDAKVFGAKIGFYYRLTMIANGYESNGKERWGITVEEREINNFDTTGGSGKIIFTYNNDELIGNEGNANYQPGSDGVDTITVDNGDVAVSVTIDRKVISNTGQGLFLNLGVTHAPTAIIDPSNYFF